MMMIIRSAESDRREIGHNPHALAFARAHGLSLGGGERRHADRIARMQARARMVARQASSYVENFDDTGKGVSQLLAPGPDDARGEVVRPPFLAEGHGAGNPCAPCSKPPQLVTVPRGGDEREADDDWRVAVHEGSHCLSGLVLFGPASLGGATIVPSETFSGRTWGPSNSAEFGSTDDVPVDLCEAMRALMPGDGEPIIAVSEIHAHVRGRCVDLLSGSEGERLLCADGRPWHAESDIAQARNLASIICSSTEATDLYLDFCRAEAATLVAKHSASIRAVAAALIEHRTLTGDQIVAVVAESVAREAMAAERQRRSDWARACANAAAFKPER